MRLPSSPGYGGKSRPSASRPSLMHWIMRAIGCPRKAKRKSNYRMPDASQCHVLREPLFVDQGAALPVIEIPLARRQSRRIAFGEAALDEPPGSSCRQHEQSDEPQLARPLFDLVHQGLAVPFATEIRMHGERSKLAHFFFWKSIQRRTADDHVVVLGDDETLDLHFQALSRAAHQDSLIFKRLDDRKNSADVIDRGAAQMRQRTRRDHGADTVAREKLQKQRGVVVARDEVRALDAVVAGTDGARQVMLHIRGQLGALGSKRLGIVRGKLCQQLASTVADAVVVHEKNKLVGSELHGNLGGDLLDREVENLSGR